MHPAKHILNHAVNLFLKSDFHNRVSPQYQQSLFKFHWADVQLVRFHDGYCSLLSIQRHQTIKVVFGRQYRCTQGSGIGTGHIAIFRLIFQRNHGSEQIGSVMLGHDLKNGLAVRFIFDRISACLL